MVDENNPAQLFVVTVSIIGLALTAGFLKVSMPVELEKSPTVLGTSTEVEEVNSGDIELVMTNTDSLKYLNQKGSSDLGDMKIVDSSLAQDYNLTISYDSDSSIILKSSSDSLDEVGNEVELDKEPVSLIKSSSNKTRNDEIKTIVESQNGEFTKGKIMITLF